MAYDRKLEKQFFDYLLSIGYPKESIVYQPAIHPVQSMNCYRPSFTLIDPEKNENLAIIEVRECKVGEGKFIYQNMCDYRKVIGSDSIPVYVVSTSDHEDVPFLLYSFYENGDVNVIDRSLFPEFKTLSAKESTERKVDLRSRSADVSDKFRKVCWSVSIVLFVLAVSDFFCKELYGTTLLTAERISIIGGALALLVIPFAQKFKGLGIEWEKTESATKSKKE